MGSLLYILHNTPPSSELYRLTLHALNIDELSDVDDNKQLITLCAYDNFLKDNRYLEAIETLGKKRFGEK